MLPCTCGKEVWDFQFSKVIEYYGVAGLGDKRKCAVPVTGGGGSCDQLVVGGGGRSGRLRTLKLQIVDRSIVRS